jgi:rSAM/selenodomain-associated transferase 2
MGSFLVCPGRTLPTRPDPVKNNLATLVATTLPLAVVIPTLNAARDLPRTIASLGGMAPEIIVVDGGSTDGTVAVAAACGTRIIDAAPGRGSQLATGCAAATQDWLLLLHADTRLAAGWDRQAATHMRAGPGRAGYFRFALDSADAAARRLERLVAWRCRALALPYGDQGLLLHRTLLRDAGGVRALPLMEDVDLVRRIGRRRLIGLDAAAVTSAEKWRREGWRRRSARNLLCLALYFAGVPPSFIARLY